MKYIYNKDELSSKIFSFIYGCSMHDAILQRAFQGEKAWVGNVEAAKEPLRKYIDCIIKSGFCSQSEHDENFIKTADEICKAINKEKPDDATDAFSFGNAQKLINIVVKHVYSICYYAPEIRENFCYCHCPLDSIMLGKVWDLYEKKFGAIKRRDKLKSPEFFRKSWGSEGQVGNCQPKIDEFPERYIIYQQAIREIIGDDNLYPIEFDYIVWK